MINEYFIACKEQRHPTKLSKCYFCGHVAPETEFTDSETIDHAGHETLVTACQDIEACLKRQKGDYNELYKR